MLVGGGRGEEEFVRRTGCDAAAAAATAIADGWKEEEDKRTTQEQKWLRNEVSTAADATRLSSSSPFPSVPLPRLIWPGARLPRQAISYGVN